MAETKYGKYIMREPHAEWTSVDPPAERTPVISIRVNSNLFKTINCDFAFLGVSEAGPMRHPAHKHDVDEFIFFIGGDPSNILDFGAEVELSLGEGKEQEKHTINTTSVVYVPKGLAHLPMNFKKVAKPVLFGHLLLAPDYGETRLE
jgi:hypothetical protein